MFRSRTLARVSLALLLSALTATRAAATVNACLNLSCRDYLAAGSVLVPTAREFTVSFRAFLRSNHGTYAEFIAQSGNFYVGVDPAYRIRIGNAWGVLTFKRRGGDHRLIAELQVKQTLQAQNAAPPDAPPPRARLQMLTPGAARSTLSRP